MQAHDPEPHRSALAPLRHAIRAATLEPESTAVPRLLSACPLNPAQRNVARAEATALVQAIRAGKTRQPFLDAFMQEFSLSEQEGIALMCLAEALIRVPDAATADRLIAEKLNLGDWAEHSGQSAGSVLMHASSWALELAGRVVDPDAALQGNWLRTLLRRAGEPAVRTALRRAIAMLGSKFVVGTDIESAARRAAREPGLALCSFDMLGEGARTAAEAERYFAAYAHSIAHLGAAATGADVHARHAVSVKLSALEPRFSLLQRERILGRLGERVTELARLAATHDIGLTIDAEEADRLDLSLDVFEAVARDARTRDWPGLGFAVQAYGRRALPIIDWLAAVAADTGRRITTRLVKGAYWDAEIKRAQERGLADYPVFTRKPTTDLAYLACASRLLAYAPTIHAQFATHNAFTITALRELQPAGVRCEFQLLYGMGEPLYEQVRRRFPDFPPVRVYAPVGAHSELLAYLVRRLLENGANSSFVNQLMDERVPCSDVVVDPLEVVGAWSDPHHPQIPFPADLYGAERTNSAGVDFGNPAEVAALRKAIDAASSRAAACDAGPDAGPGAESVLNPARISECVGRFMEATAEQIDAAFHKAAAAQPAWNALGGATRAAMLERAADALQADRGALCGLLVREAGKTLPDAIAELREAADFCRYYAAQARRNFSAPLSLPGPTGERNELTLHGRGVFACVSPWNFPLAIFTGQLAAALAAGNAVVAKPAEATPLVATRAVALLHAAGIPRDALQLMLARGPAFGAVAWKHDLLGGVAFTGSTRTALQIYRALAAREGAIVPLIAETGGLNAMIVDSSALLEQVVDDVLLSGFTSAGQRCSALRLLFVQEDVAERLIRLLRGAMDELVVGDPADPATDVGPVISAAARQALEQHVEALRASATVLHQCALDARHATGHFVAPTLVELRDARQLDHEAFGPVVHLVRFAAGQLPAVIQAIRASGYGLTLGVQTRLDGAWQEVQAGTAIGNTYVNRSMIGAVVGTQPFGGQGLSGTGPKAGGPHYLLRFAVERCLTVNTSAAGGNTTLLGLGI
jgi:RHH-type transcriptional regulator, proline utilization regulon repressor / proline dehydrogenase / delta 1-pyrroline-5-carboxylate dehydrogenase